VATSAPSGLTPLRPESGRCARAASRAPALTIRMEACSVADGSPDLGPRLWALLLDLNRGLDAFWHPSSMLAPSVSLSPKLRVTTAEMEYMPFYLRTFFRVPSSWVHWGEIVESLPAPRSLLVASARCTSVVHEDHDGMPVARHGNVEPAVWQVAEREDHGSGALPDAVGARNRRVMRTRTTRLPSVLGHAQSSAPHLDRRNSDVLRSPSASGNAAVQVELRIPTLVAPSSRSSSGTRRGTDITCCAPFETSWPRLHPVTRARLDKRARGAIRVSAARAGPARARPAVSSESRSYELAAHGDDQRSCALQLTDQASPATRPSRSGATFS
jgi:hypothetical protein